MLDVGCWMLVEVALRAPQFNQHPTSNIQHPRSEHPLSFMKVLVIGGTMFIGRLLIAELLKAGHEITVMHRKPKHDFGRRVQNLMADRNDPESVREALRFTSFQVVFDNVYDWERGTTASQVEGTAQAVLAASGD